MFRLTPIFLLFIYGLGCHSEEPSRIHHIQGSAQRSPLAGQEVRGVVGLVTAIDQSEGQPGFWIQDTEGDGDDTTSEGLFVSTALLPKPVSDVRVGQTVEVSGRVEEWLGERSGDLPLTRLLASQTKILDVEQRSLPAAVRLGQSGKTGQGGKTAQGKPIPRTVSAAIDFFESLEGMRVEVDQALVVGPSSKFGDITVVADGGRGIPLRSRRGGVVLGQDDPHPERLLVASRLLGQMPTLNVGARFETPFTGVLDYGFSNFRILPETLPEATPAPAISDPTTLRPTERQITLATFNVFNLSARDPVDKLRRLAETVVQDLAAPDIVALQEVQDENGPDDDGVVDAKASFEGLIETIETTGGPRYHFRQINPIDKSDGGQPGGNIRVGFLFNPQRVEFIDRGQAHAQDETQALSEDNGPRLSHSPGRVAPMNPAFENSRKPLAAEFLYQGSRLFVIATHLASKRGDDPIMGSQHPPVRPSEKLRAEQARALRALMENLIEIDPKARVVVLGDMNELEFRPPMLTLKGSDWTNLVERIPVDDRYTFNFDGNSQALDHVLISPALAKSAAPEIDIVHVNADRAYTRRGSDHDPVVVRLSWP